MDDSVAADAVQQQGEAQTSSEPDVGGGLAWVEIECLDSGGDVGAVALVEHRGHQSSGQAMGMTQLPGEPSH
jgi:hypothetical protein